jgi:hypothetical protein
VTFAKCHTKVSPVPIYALDRVLSNSPSASVADAAREKVDARERALIAEGREARVPPEPKDPAGYRTKKKLPAKKA